MPAITVEQYLLLKNTLNLQLLIALQKFDMLHARGDDYGFFKKDDIKTIVSDVKKLNECLTTLDKCVKAKRTFIETAVALEPFILLDPS
jgi:hypothetical protein